LTRAAIQIVGLPKASDIPICGTFVPGAEECGPNPQESATVEKAKEPRARPSFDGRIIGETSGFPCLTILPAIANEGNYFHAVRIDPIREVAH